MSLRSVKELRGATHLPSLLAGLLHFEVSFAVWVLLSVLSPYIREDIAVSPGLRGVILGVPFASSSLCRIVVGFLSDRFGPRRVGTITMTAVILPLLYGALFTDSVAELIAVSAVLGLAGASFAVALPLAAAHTVPEKRGLALGIAGAGNSGTVLAGLLAPRLAGQFGWHTVLAGAAILVACAAIGFRLIAREAPVRPPEPMGVSLARIRGSDLVRLCALYATTFGGYVGLAAWLPSMYVDRFGVSPVMAGGLTALAAGAGSLMRPVGGAVADRYGGVRVVSCVLAGAAVLLLGIGAAPTLMMTVMLATMLLGSLGAGNGAVFQVVGLRYGASVGLATGIIGAAGGVGGFLLPTALGAVRAWSGSETVGFVFLAVVPITMLAATFRVRLTWAFAPMPEQEQAA